MKSALSSLQDKKEAFEAMKRSYENAAAHIQVRHPPRTPPPGTRSLSRCVLLQVQARFVETQTHAEFEKLRSFLRAEEETRMQALKREEEQRSAAVAEKIEKIVKDMTSLSDCIRALEADLASDSISMLHVSLKYPDYCDDSHAKSLNYLLFHFPPSELQEDAGKVLKVLITVLNDFYGGVFNQFTSAPQS